MRRLDWSNTPYVRVCRQDSPGWKRLKWESQGVYLLLLRHLDRAGRVALDGLEPWEAVAEMTGCPDDVAERSTEKLIGAGFLEVGDGSIVDPEFLAREETSKSDAERQRESRVRRRDLALVSRNVTEATENVTDATGNESEASRAVTSSHAASHRVTPTRASPPLPVPTCASPDQTEGSATRPADVAEAPPTDEGGEKPKKSPKKKGRTIPPVKIPDSLRDLAGITEERFAQRVRTCSKTKKPESWQSELDGLAKLLWRVNGSIISDFYEEVCRSEWMGCVEILREKIEKESYGAPRELAYHAQREIEAWQISNENAAKGVDDGRARYDTEELIGLRAALVTGSESGSFSMKDFKMDHHEAPKEMLDFMIEAAKKARKSALDNWNETAVAFRDPMQSKDFDDIANEHGAHAGMMWIYEEIGQ